MKEFDNIQMVRDVQKQNGEKTHIHLLEHQQSKIATTVVKPSTQMMPSI